MKAKAIPSAWMRLDGRRFDCGPYMSGALEAKIRLEELAYPKTSLSDLCHDGNRDGIFHAGRESRWWVNSPQHGVPYLSSSSVLRSDLSGLPFIHRSQVESNPRFTITEGWTLITRSGTIGRMVYARPDMDGLACSEHVMRIAPNVKLVLPGYVYAFLASKFGLPLVVSGTYGSIIQSIEPQHLASIPVPRLHLATEAAAHEGIQAAAVLRAEAQLCLVEATHHLLQCADLSEQTPEIWHSHGSQVGFAATIGVSHSLRAANYSPRVASLLDRIRRGPHRSLGDICSNGHLGTGARFKRIDCDPELGVRLVGQKQGFWIRPEGRWISATRAPDGIFAADESVMIASSGTLGEHELYCRPIFITGRWREHAYTQHFFRVVSGTAEVSGAFLYAFLRSELAFRCLRSMSTGSKQQEIHRDLIARLPIPLLERVERDRIENLVRGSFRKRDEADAHEDEAIALVEHAIAGGA
jgi:hypothetical protein